MISLELSPIPFIWVALSALAVWRLTHLIHAEDGPWKCFERLRQWLGKSFFGELVGCFYCLSLWIALPFGLVLGPALGERAVLWLALSALAILIESVHRRLEPTPVVYFEPSLETASSKEVNE